MLGALEYLPEAIEDWRNNCHKIVGQESFGSEISRKEGAITIAADNENHTNQANISAVWLEPSPVSQLATIKALSFGCVVVADESDANDDKVDDLTSGDEDNEPSQHLCGVAGDGEERKEREDHCNAEAVDWDTLLGALLEEFWSFAFERQTVQASNGGICVCVTGREDTGDQKSIDKVWKTLDS